MKDARYLDHDALRDIRLDVTDRTILEQIAAIRRSYRFQTKKRLKFRHAVEWLDLITTSFRESVAAAPKTGFALQCPWCYAGEEDLVINANDLTTIQCCGCYKTFTPEEARRIIAEALAPWDRFLATTAPLERGTAAEELAGHRREEQELAPSCHCLGTASA